ncbi:MAG: Hsp20/alpha crystallin family protein [Rhodospirillaceae bacterium]
MTQQLPTPPKSGITMPFADLDRFFGHWVRNWPFTWPETATTQPRALRAFEHMPNVEVKENGKSYTVNVELPGLDEKDVKVTIEDDLLSIAGEKKVEHTDDKTHFSERSYGSFTRSFTLPADADRSAIAAKFTKGVLTLEIPKTAEVPAQGKQIEVKAG